MTSQQPIHVHQRSTGMAGARFALASGRTQLKDLYQSGSAKAIILDGREAVFLNTSGGLTGGDTLEYSLSIGPDADVSATTQTAERIYRSTSGAAQMNVTMHVAAGAHLDWLPQETILFDKAHARRKTEISLAPGASCLMAETLILGRAAMGETVNTLDFRDARVITRAGRPVHFEALKLNTLRLRAKKAGLNGARALATVVLVAPNAERLLGVVRHALVGQSVRAAASTTAGRLIVRFLAKDGMPLRKLLIEILTLLRGSPLPRVWQV
ncbi:MAG: urease accessory protein UreD [Roseinatronobacter sp.]